jgi:hypothetical protein
MKRYIKQSTLIFWLTLAFSLSLLMLTACQQMEQPTSLPSLNTAEATATPLQSTTEQTQDISGTDTVVSVITAEPVVEVTEAATPTELPLGFWRDLPVIPTGISDAMRAVYRKGLAMGNDPHVFTKLGDCNSMSPDFLHGFGGMYDLGEFTYLQPAIDYYQKSFRLPNQATNPGTTTSRLLSSLWTNDECMADELMLDCQFRLDNPSITFIALGTIDAKYNYLDSTAFERNLRVIIESTLERGIVPILATKADNIEGDDSINETIARLAVEYELPLWNFWKAAQDTRNHGLLPDLEHLNSWSGPPATDFSLPISLEYGKEMKNITALEMLDFMMRELAIPETQATPSP